MERKRFKVAKVEVSMDRDNILGLRFADADEYDIIIDVSHGFLQEATFNQDAVPAAMSLIGKEMVRIKTEFVGRCHTDDCAVGEKYVTKIYTASDARPVELDWWYFPDKKESAYPFQFEEYPVVGPLVIDCSTGEVHNELYESIGIKVEG